jgi:hypothetical protein
MATTTERQPRRTPRFETFDEILADVRALAERPTRQIGNWSLGQVCQHLGLAMEFSTRAERPFRVPLKLRILGRLARRRVLRDGLPRGFKLPADGQALVPEPVSVEDGLATLERGMAALAATGRRVPHPVLGSMNAAQWHQFHLRHAELHLGHIVVVEAEE